MNALYPKVTVITPSYNQGQFIEATILSVLNQTYPNIEYIVVDGGSTDQTMRIVDTYRDRIDTVIHEKDRGQSDAINKGFRLATGKLVGWINSDDLLYPDCIERIMGLHRQHPDGAVYYGAQNDWINAQGRVIGIRHLPIPDRQYLLNRNYDVIQQGSFYPTRLVRELGCLNESIHYCMDLDLWLRLLTRGPIYAYHQHPIAAFRKWEETKTTLGGTKFLRDIRRVLHQQGVSPYAPTVLRTHYQAFKLTVKQTLRAV
ncbi:MAG: glycosyltransferase [Bacteroidetes bacterium]|nr:glycosyltransferase [Fibrella sp.]